MNSWRLFTRAFDGIGGSSTAVDSTVSSPFSLARTVTDGGASSTTTYDFAWDDVGGTGGSFNWDFDHERIGAAGSNATTAAFDALSFTISGQDMLYDFSGAYSMVGARGIVGLVNLVDETGDSLFRWTQHSNSSPNESFVVGRGGDGDAFDVLTGSSSGTLPAGHTYSLFYGFQIENDTSTADSGATDGGNLQMNITAIPAPGAALLAALGLPMVGWAKRRFA